jgi:hypothetical protein
MNVLGVTAASRMVELINQKDDLDNLQKISVATTLVIRDT